MKIEEKIDMYLLEKTNKELYIDGSEWPVVKSWSFDKNTMGYNIKGQAALATYEKGTGSDDDYITFKGNPKYMSFEGQYKGKKIKGKFKNMKDVEKLLKKYK